MKTVIVATDYSSEATNAAHYAAALAQYTRARIILFNSYQLPEHKDRTLFSSAKTDHLMAENRAYLEKLAGRLADQYGIRVDCWTNLTYVAEGLNMLVRRYDADLVVMGMWKNGREDNLFGNTTTFVISRASYPVLVVPEGLCFKRIKNILFSWDPGSLSDSNSLSLLKELAACFKAEVQIFHVDQEVELLDVSLTSRRAPLEQSLQGVRQVYRNLEENDVLAGIERGIKEFKSDLLVMVPQKPDFSESYESRTREMALRTRVPLLAIPN